MFRDVPHLGGGVGSVLSPISRITSATALAFILNSSALAQCSVNSSTGYAMHAQITLKQLVKPASCPYGYNYNLKVGYEIWFTGTNIPGSMYTLQARAHCGSQNLFFDLPNDGGTGEVTTTANPWRGATDCNTATLSLLGCRNIVLEVQGPGISYQNIGCSATILPITLVDFGARIQDDRVAIHWTTAMERDNDLFTVERSLDGIQFEGVLQVPSAGNSNALQHYEVDDAGISTGIVYYRLRQTDLDGTSTLSDVVPVTFSNRRNTLVHPNPVEQDVITLSGTLTTGAATITDATGKVVYTGMVDRMMDVGRLPSGTYLLRIIDEEGRATSSTMFTKV